MDIEKTKKKFLKALSAEQSELMLKLTNNARTIQALGGVTDNIPGDGRKTPKRKRKMSAAHRKAIADGIRKAKAAKAKKAGE